LKHVRFITIYLWFLGGASYIDNVTLTKAPDESMNF
jgi:hypothetical protein